ncbi:MULTISPECIES: acyl-CoA thioesterase [unclassified Empedobacter]|uniref:acyl-CoA thioesterase n=1 Tax=unclassified Empedobacter TaxID=2643773 RepID=UPI00244BA0FF|nr:MULTISPECIES: acyl-CoA thioesterase [unclassified Empedobacter]MDH0659734.1 acyl-CoA thioesterase [Empedobacter sp. GD03865]MDH0674594.1 acyl-CoA thioesterase [Empedobacter sp. GD03861]
MISSEEKIKTLVHNSNFAVRFNETHPLGIVWHGNYITYFEDGRESFGRHFGISYLDIQKSGFVIPIIKSVCEHKFPLKYGDKCRIETTFEDTLAAKMIYKFKIFNQDEKLVCIGETTQVFLDNEGDLMLTLPPFFEEWKKKVGLL